MQDACDVKVERRVLRWLIVTYIYTILMSLSESKQLQPSDKHRKMNANRRFYFRAASLRIFQEMIPTSQQRFDPGGSFTSFDFSVNFLRGGLYHSLVIRLDLQFTIRTYIYIYIYIIFIIINKKENLQNCGLSADHRVKLKEFEKGISSSTLLGN